MVNLFYKSSGLRLYSEAHEKVLTMNRSTPRAIGALQSGKLDSPYLAFSTSYWALLQLPHDIPYYIGRLCSMGFEYFEVGLHPERIAPTREILRQSGLKLIGQGWAKTFVEAKPYIDLAHSLGAIAINMHLGHAYMSTQEAADLVTTCREYANNAGLPCTVETHRGRCTQDLLRTSEWLKLAPDTAFCLDVSHYVVAGEGWGGNKQLFLEHLQPIMENSILIHGRIGDGENIQCAVGMERMTDFTEATVEIWANAMKMWLDRAEAGDVLVFEPELGPPPYAQIDSNGKETSDRWEQTLEIARLARKAWEIAMSVRGDRSYAST